MQKSNTKKYIPKKNWLHRDVSFYRRKFWQLFVFGFGTIILFFLLASWGVFGAMPSFEELENPESNLATEVISSDGVTIGKFYNENRTMIKYNALPQELVKALVSTEDERFYEHSGIDSRGTLRAVMSVGTSGGASTITQQLAKLLFHGEGSKNLLTRMVQKAKEWIIAIRLERQYTKNEIIAMYLNKADFVNTAVGIRSASKVYFNKEPKELNIEECAMLVGMLKNPSLFNPIRRMEKTRQRRNVVLHQMVKNNFLSEAEKQSLENKPITLDFHPESHKEGIATYFREYLREFMKKWVRENKKADGSEYDIYSDGLKIYVTIDSRMQEYAEDAVMKHLANLQIEFTNQQKDNKNKPFVRISKDETDKIILSAMKNSDRWKQMAAQDSKEEDIIKSFSVPTKMTVFTWKGEKDTTMTPIDSIRYYKSFLQAGLMAMEPKTGQIKAWGWRH